MDNLSKFTTKRWVDTIERCISRAPFETDIFVPTQINNLFGTANDRTEHKVEHDEKKGITSVSGISPSELRSRLNRLFNTVLSPPPQTFGSPPRNARPSTFSSRTR